MPRLFIAVEIGREAALSLSLLRGGLPPARWIDPENYHLTLRFIGDIDTRTADEIVASLDRIERPAFDLSLLGLGVFGSKKPHSVYAGVSPSRDLELLQGDVDRAVRRLGLPAEAKKFTPHVTLARLRSPRAEDVAHYLSSRGGFRTQPFPVRRFCLFSSRDSVGGGPYVMEEAFDLRTPRSAAAGAGLHLCAAHPAR